jgi:hypothetical protein
MRVDTISGYVGISPTKTPRAYGGCHSQITLAVSVAIDVLMVVLDVSCVVVSMVCASLARVASRMLMRLVDIMSMILCGSVCVLLY